MKIRHLKVQNFRGIKFLETIFTNDVVGFFGPCDSTKTTILDAIDFCLSPRWNLIIDDSDFYNGDIEKNIEIDISLIDIPTKLVADKKFGLYLRGWDDINGLTDEPNDSNIPTLTIRLKISKSLEPEWMVINDRIDEPVRISSPDRESLGLSRIGYFMDRDLTWTRGSLLSKFTGKVEDIQVIITNVNREARKTTDLTTVSEFVEASKKVTELSSKLGVNVNENFLPQFDTKSFFGTVSGISLFKEEIPLRLFGLGTKNLITLSIGLETFFNGSIILIDEIERGLEPFRIRHLLNELKKKSIEPESKIGQIFFATHSPIVMAELPSNNYYLVRSLSGITTVKNLDASFQDIIRAAPEALLSKRVIVCEGKTEYGMCKSLDKYWQSNLPNKSFAQQGIALLDGAGSNSCARAEKLKTLEYDTMLFIDSDKLNQLNPSMIELNRIGIKTIYWSDNVSTEERIFLDMSEEAIKELLDITYNIYDIETVNLHIKNVDTNQIIGHVPIDELLNNQLVNLRPILGKAAKKYKWFKTIDLGEQIGNIIIKHWNACESTNLIDSLNAIKIWAHE